jgi:hypothetical protein
MSNQNGRYGPLLTFKRENESLLSEAATLEELE